MTLDMGLEDNITLAELLRRAHLDPVKPLNKELIILELSF